MKLLISHKSRPEFIDFLENNSIDYLFTIDNPRLDKRIADHPDLSVFALDRENIIVDKEVFSYYKENLPGINIIAGESVGETYPHDAIYNVVKYKRFFVHNDFTEKHILSYMANNSYKFIRVNQGYTRCSSIVLKDSILTADYGLYKALKDKLDILLLEPEEIELDGFDRGFLGGCCGMVDENTIIFNGKVQNPKSYDIINRQCDKENIKLIYPDCDLLDTGSLMMLG